ncbi:MAG TPA: hypothetical protein VN397_05225 [Candidatus Methylomirabilis sp.]|nr:hypothetical protein [Candidatus Methylomirabilis sp.]
MSGPRTPSEIQRARRDREASRETTPSLELERLPGHDALINYLQRKGRGRDCTDELHCYPERYEPTLESDLYAARHAGNETALRDVREVIWAGSWRLHKTHDPMLAARFVDAIRNGVEREREQMERTHPQDAKDFDETILELVRVSAVLRGLETGETVEPALQTIEDWYAVTLQRANAERGLPRMREQAKKQIASLRMIRDELYYSRLFPNWAQTRNAVMRISLKRP